MQLTQRLKDRFMGDRTFYRTVASIALPIIFQTGTTNLVNLLDNIMVGQLGTAALSGVAIANQLIFVFNLSVFGGVAGPGIFGAQFFGADDMEGVRNTLRLKWWIGFLLFSLSLVAFLGFGPDLVKRYLTGEDDPAAAQQTMAYALEYLHIMLIGFVPFVLTMSFAGTLREGGETMLPMQAGIIAVLINLAGNYVLIFGHLGFPALGVKGAAIATVFSRFVELAIILYATRYGTRHHFLHGILRQLKVPWPFVLAVLKKGAPLIANEFIWSMGMATLVQLYSVRGLEVVAGHNIATMINQMFNVVFISLGDALAVIVGQHLGASRLKEARRDVRRLMALSFSLSALIGGTMALLSPYFPNLYNNTAQQVRILASRFILTMGLFMPLYAINHGTYYTLRSGGCTFITFLYDAVYLWAVHIPVAWALVHLTSLPMAWLFPLSELAGVLKMTFGLRFLRKGVWVRNIVYKI